MGHLLEEIISDGAIVEINTDGAELYSIKDIFGTEYLWQGDAAYWGRRAPILFPIVGEQKDGMYAYKGKQYQIKRHGFARDMPFHIIAKKRDSITLSLSSNQETLKVYPFRFQLTVTYTVIGVKLEIKYRVANIGDSEMLFCIGAHPGFNCPILNGEKFEDYVVEFEKPETCSRLIIGKNGLYGGAKSPLLSDERIVRLDHTLFDCDAIVPDKLVSKSATLKSIRSGRGVEIAFNNFKTFAIWSPSGNAPFVCLEPWVGHASCENDGLQLEQKNDIVNLPCDQYKEFSYNISLL